jgi:acylpyruvate hydrolase
MKIICVGRNYSDHAKELNNDVPTEPVIFIKPKGALLIPEKPLYYPEFTDDLQYECEVVVKINKNGKYIQERFANKYYSEVSLGIDFHRPRSAAQAADRKACRGRSPKASTARLPLVLSCRFPHERRVNDLDFELKLNGETVQSSNSKQHDL